ncbi:hypothetical protein [Roseivivax marinus]|uniref:hypothetical protein n=1 Tax=Roseivivax marinus TaxID=1379903 RepID=UPI00273EC004|nr:hypothetical protein [Roseivivax marinus]
MSSKPDNEPIFSISPNDEQSTAPDPLLSIGLGLGASERARELVLKGLILEMREDVDKRLAAFRRGRGQPPKAISHDELRAAKIMSLRDVIGARTVSDAIQLAKQVETILVENGFLSDGARLFSHMTSEPSLVQSVSRGFRSLGTNAREVFEK